MPDVALVVLDTVRADVFDDAFDWLDGTHFSRAYATSNWTVPSHASLFTGRYPSEVGVYGQSPTLDCPERTLAEAFSASGRRTRCLTANPQLHQYEGWERGFDEFVGPANLGRTDEAVFDWGGHIDATEPGLRRNLSGLWHCLADDVDAVRSIRRGYDLYRRPRYDGGALAVRDHLRETDVQGDDLLFVNLMDAHTPYRPEPGESEAVDVVIADALAGTVDDSDRIRAAYRASVEHLATVYRDIYAELDDAFDYVVTLSDHGELLGEHGLWNHSVGLHPELVHVPLVVSGPTVPDETCREVVDLLDVHRTVADLADVDVDSRGRHLFGDRTPTEHLTESHGVLPFHRAQFERKGLSMDLFERWATTLHGFVTEDGAYCYESDPDSFRVVGETAVGDPRDRLSSLVRTLDTRDVDGDEPDVSATARARLEELGYA